MIHIKRVHQLNITLICLGIFMFTYSFYQLFLKQINYNQKLDSIGILQNIKNDIRFKHQYSFKCI